MVGPFQFYARVARSALCYRLYAYHFSFFGVEYFIRKYHLAVGQRKEGMIFAYAYIFSSSKAGSSLSNDDISGYDLLATEYFYTQPFAVRFTPVSGTTATFFMCHEYVV